ADEVERTGTRCQRANQLGSEVRYLRQPVSVDLVPVVGGAMIVLVEVGEDVQYRPAAAVEGGLVAGAVAVTTGCYDKAGLGVQGIDQALELRRGGLAVDDE